MFEGGVNKGEFFSLESSMDLWEWFLVFHFQDRNRCTNFLWEGNCAPELREQDPALPQSIFQELGREFGITGEGGFPFQPGQGVLEMLEGPCCSSHSPPAAPSFQSFQETALSQSGLEGIWRIICFQNPSRRELDPFSTPKNQPSYGGVKFSSSVSQWLPGYYKIPGLLMLKLILIKKKKKELEASVKTTGYSQSFSEKPF